MADFIILDRDLGPGRSGRVAFLVLLLEKVGEVFVEPLLLDRAELDAILRDLLRRVETSKELSAELE